MLHPHIKRVLRPLVRLARRMPLVRDLPVLRFPEPEPPPRSAEFDPHVKRRKLERTRPLLRPECDIRDMPGYFDALTPELRQRAAVADTENVSANNYDPTAKDLIEKYADGLILDCGAGLRNVYYDNVVNLEIVPYPTTDVLAVGECLPFRDGSFDAVFSFNVLEHVRDPFACAAEIARVLKPGGELYCVVPFLQPLHGYPHHFYNMTHEGLRTLFEPHLRVEKQEVLASGLPIFTLTWFLRRWAAELPEMARYHFLRMRVEDLIGEPVKYLSSPAVKELPAAVNFELASATALFARKAA